MIVQTLRNENIRKLLSIQRENILSTITLAVIFLFLLGYFKPSLILLDTMTSGGDTGSHNYPLWYLKYNLLPKGRLSGWSPGWYAGFPMFQFYFVLPFLLMVMLSYLLPLWVSFKLVTVLGTFLLPITMFASMKLMRFKFPSPAVAAVLTLPFLFMEANSMWGGNIPSTLAGEFSYSISFALAILFLGLVYSAIRFKRCWVLAAVVFAGVVLCHIYTAIAIATAPIFFLLNDRRSLGEFKKNFIQLFKIYSLAFLLSAFWALPLFAKLQYATPYHYIWSSVTIKEIYPKILLPTIVFCVAGVYKGLKSKDDRIRYLLFAIIMSFFLYKLSPILGFTDIRFVPFLQFLPALVAAYFISYTKILQKTNLILIPILVILVLTLWWVDKNVTYIDFWIKWNYEGFQSKNHWQQLINITTFLHDLPEGRVVHEYSNTHDKFGTPRTFENMPLFSGKPTLEGLNIESALSAPYVFIIQAKISATSTCPIPKLNCGVFNIKSAEKYLELFNIRYIVATTGKLKDAIKEETGWPLLRSFGEIDVYEVGHTNYTTIPKYKPLLFKKQGSNWKELSLEWFKGTAYIDVPIIFANNQDTLNYPTVGYTITELDEASHIPLATECKIFSEEVEDDEISIKTNCIRTPILIKVSYFPNWRVEGADKIYLVSPSFMMVFPEQENVRLYYDHTISDYIGICLSILGVATLFTLIVFRKIKF